MIKNVFSAYSHISTIVQDHIKFTMEKIKKSMSSYYCKYK